MTTAFAHAPAFHLPSLLIPQPASSSSRQNSYYAAAASSYPSPPPTMHSTSHQQQQQQQQHYAYSHPTLPPLSSIVPSSSAASSHVAHRQTPPRQRTRSSGSGSGSMSGAQQQQPQRAQPQQLHPPPHHPHPSTASSSSQGTLTVPSSAQSYQPWTSSDTMVATVPTTPTNGVPASHYPSRSTVQTTTTPETTRKRTADFVAHNTCAMVCYLWFGHPTPHQTTSPAPHTPYSPSVDLPPTDSSLARLQFIPSKAFVEFMHSLLTTTQVSQSVIVLSLHYIYRLKCANPEIKVMEGSELRLAVAALMLANKFLDDNTYTNLTWSQISHIALPEINLMEREFLAGVGFNLFVDQKAYDGWLLMLNGLMWAKEREYESWRRAWYGSAASSAALGLADRSVSSTVSVPRPPRQHHHQPDRHAAQRARSTSPTASYPFTFTLPPLQEPPLNPFLGALARPATAQQQQPPPPIPVATRPTGSKRSAVDAAFSPEETIMPPNKRRPMSSIFPTGGLEYAQHQHQHHYQPPPLILAPPQYRMEKLEVDDRSASSGGGDRSRSSSADEGLPMDRQVGSTMNLAAGLGRMSLEPMVKKEELDEDDEELQLAFGGGMENAGGVLQLSAPYRPDEKLAGKGVPKYLQFNTLVASPSVMIDPRYQQQDTHHPQQQQYHQEATLNIPPPQMMQQPQQQPASQFYLHAPTRKTVMRYQEHQPLAHHQHHHHARQLYPLPAMGNSGARSARTSPTVGVHHQQRMELDPPAPSLQHHHSYQQRPSVSANGRLPPLATASSWTSNNVYSEPPSALPTPPPVRSHEHQYQQQQSNFANAGPPGYTWRSGWGQQPQQQQQQQQQPHVFQYQQQQHQQQQQSYGYPRSSEQQQTL